MLDKNGPNPKALFESEQSHFPDELVFCWTDLPLERRWEELAIANDFAPDRLARIWGISRRTLERWFRRYGLHPCGWLREVRLKQAYRRLREGQPIKAVAQEIGYLHLSNFSRDFKQVFGAAPRYLPYLGDPPKPRGSIRSD